MGFGRRGVVGAAGAVAKFRADLLWTPSGDDSGIAWADAAASDS